MKNKQLTNATPGFVPVLTTEAGSALTVADWESIGVKTASYHLATLLMKPGFTLLSQLPSLASYVGWQGCLVLNASDLVMDGTGNYVVRSQYDGSTSRYTSDQVFTLIETLRPDALILPRCASYQAWCGLTKAIEVFVSLDKASEVISMERLSGVFVTYDEGTFSLPALLAKRAPYQHLPCYVVGDVRFELLQMLIAAGIEWIETNRPARDALQGVVYCAEGERAINDPAMEMVFQPLDPACACSTCATGLTRAYLHHLYAQTPGLSQRFLIQHNAQESVGPISDGEATTDTL